MPGCQRPADERATEDRRGQTTLDFVLAIGVFVVAVAFVFGFVPGMVEPFAQDRAEGQVADRVADAVVEDLADEAAEPGELNETETAAFFDGSVDIADRAGVDSRYGISVTLGRPVAGDSGLDVLCGESGDVHSCEAGGEALEAGESAPATSTTIGTARRTVVVDDRVAIVHVRVWS